MSEPEPDYERVPIYDALIDILRPLRLVIEEVGNEVCGEGVTPELRGQPAPFAQFDAGHLCAAETIIKSYIDDEYEGYKRYVEEECGHKLLRAIYPGLCCTHPEGEHETAEYRGDKPRHCLHPGCSCKRWKPLDERAPRISSEPQPRECTIALE